MKIKIFLFVALCMVFTFQQAETKCSGSQVCEIWQKVNSNDGDSWLRFEKTGLPLFWLCVWPVCWRSRWRQDPRWRSPRVHLPMWRESRLGHCHNGHNNHIAIVAKLSQMFSTLQYQFSLLHSSSTRSAVATTWSSIEVTSLTKIATSLDLDICRNRWLFFIQSKLNVRIEWQS